MCFAIVCIVVLAVGRGSNAECPHEDPDLQLWSSDATWSTNKVPKFNDSVVVSGKVLLNVDKLPEFFSITITGKLVLSPDVKHDITTQYILIHEHGELHIGSEDCKFTGEAVITLIGEPEEKLGIPNFGEKFLGVGPDGTLELHGLKTRTWTKLTATAEKYQPNSGIIFDHEESELDEFTKSGVFVYQFGKDGIKKNGIFAQLRKNTQEKEEKSIEKVSTFIQDIPNDDIVLFVTQKDISGPNDLTNLFSVIDGLIGKRSQLHGIVAGAAYSLIVVKGNTAGVQEDLQLLDTGFTFVEAKTTLVFEDYNTEFIAIANNNVKYFKAFVDVKSYNLEFTRPIIEVYDDVSSWEIGSKIFITSTDYNWQQVEEFTRENCPTCSPKQIRLSGPLQYTHFGQIHKNVDMRAEVGVTTHNIRIQGKVSPGNNNGGHMKAIKHFKSVHIEGVEFTNMGQPLVLGRYPCHFHMCEDLADTSLYSNLAYVRYNSFHHNQFRCLTIHGTQNLVVTGNVCYDSFGHGYFLEDGGEKYTTLIGNLGAGMRKWKGDIQNGVTGALPSDDKPVVFWLTNPLVTVKNNVAAGSDGVGYWFVYPIQPVGPSRAKNWYAEFEARHTKITKFENNVAHSNTKAGLFVDNTMHDDLTIHSYNKYDPKENPLDKDSKSISAYFDRFTGFKNADQNVWIRGELMVMRNCSLSDSLIGAEIIRQFKVYQRLENCVILGDSINTGEPEDVKLENGTWIMWPSSSPNPNKFWKTRLGYVFNKGPNFVENVYFDHFKPTAYYAAAALGFKDCSESFHNTRSQVKNVTFAFDDPDEGNRVFDSDENIANGCSRDGDIMKNFRDVDGDVCETTEASHVLRPIGFHVTDKCHIRKNWNKAWCTSRYGTVDFWYRDEKQNLVTMIRTDTPYASDTVDQGMATHFLVILGGSHTYLSYMTGNLPGKIRIKGQDVTKKYWVRVGFCIPRDAEVTTFYSIGDTTITTEEVHSLQEVDNDGVGGKYYIDGTVGVIFFKLIHEIEFASDDKYSCPENRCPQMEIRFQSGDSNDMDCSQRFLETQEYIKPNTGDALIDTRKLKATAGDTPPTNFGAGSTYPF